MLLENMQREDLTALEQADGFQMMIDLGDNVKTISEQTGFSQTTVRSRLKLLELDRETLEKQGREIPITAYIKLEQIKDVDRRNRVLKEIGTNNFDWALKRAISEEKNERDKNEWFKRFEDMKLIDISDLSYADRWAKYKSLGTCYYSDSVEKAMKLIPDDAEQVYYTTEYSWFGLFIEKPDIEEPDDEETLARKKAEQERQEKNSALLSLAEMCRESVMDFCHRYKSKSDSDEQIIMRLFAFLLIEEPDTEFDPESIIDVDLIVSWNKDDVDVTLSDVPEINDVPSALLSLVVDSYCGTFRCFDYSNNYDEDKVLIAIYQAIRELGYEASDEELEYIDGNHELYNEEVE